MKTRLQMYRYLYVIYKEAYKHFGYSQDMASRKANIKCVKTTNKFYLKQFEEK